MPANGQTIKRKRSYLHPNFRYWWTAFHKLQKHEFSLSNFVATDKEPCGAEILEKFSDWIDDEEEVPQWLQDHLALSGYGDLPERATSDALIRMQDGSPIPPSRAYALVAEENYKYKKNKANDDVVGAPLRSPAPGTPVSTGRGRMPGATVLVSPDTAPPPMALLDARQLHAPNEPAALVHAAAAAAPAAARPALPAPAPPTPAPPAPAQHAPRVEALIVAPPAPTEPATALLGAAPAAGDLEQVGAPPGAAPLGLGDKVGATGAPLTADGTIGRLDDWLEKVGDGKPFERYMQFHMKYAYRDVSGRRPPYEHNGLPSEFESVELTGKSGDEVRDVVCRDGRGLLIVQAKAKAHDSGVSKGVIGEVKMHLELSQSPDYHKIIKKELEPFKRILVAAYPRMANPAVCRGILGWANQILQDPCPGARVGVLEWNRDAFGRSMRDSLRETLKAHPWLLQSLNDELDKDFTGVAAIPRSR